jgi:hypothetical protein
LQLDPPKRRRGLSLADGVHSEAAIAGGQTPKTTTLSCAPFQQKIMQIELAL